MWMVVSVQKYITTNAFYIQQAHQQLRGKNCNETLLLAALFLHHPEDTNLLECSTTYGCYTYVSRRL